MEENTKNDRIATLAEAHTERVVSAYHRANGEASRRFSMGQRTVVDGAYIAGFKEAKTEDEEPFATLVSSCLTLDKEVAELKLKLEAERTKVAELSEQTPIVWRAGAPEQPWRDEWFMARLDNGERVVLRALPEEHGYDFKTADETYYKAFRIKSWAQFPDSQYVSPSDYTECPTILHVALRQYMHNDGSGLLMGYDYEETTRIVLALKYKAELYDEVWALATGMGHMNVTTALDTLKRERDAACAGQPKAWLDVKDERRRQVEAEGWTPEHDDKHNECELAAAAACYALGTTDMHCKGARVWPWTPGWWKPEGGYRRMLIKAGALIFAEIERLDRQGGAE